MTAEAPPLGELEASRPYPARTGPKGNLVYRLITTTDHKMIGIMYVVTCFIFFFIGGLLALLMRTELAAPGLQFLSNEQFNQLFTMHGTIMIVPCMVNSWLNCSLDKNCRPGAANSVRISSASRPPMKKKMKQVTTYMIPIIL